MIECTWVGTDHHMGTKDCRCLCQNDLSLDLLGAATEASHQHGFLSQALFSG